MAHTVHLSVHHLIVIHMLHFQSQFESLNTASGICMFTGLVMPPALCIWYIGPCVYLFQLHATCTEYIYMYSVLGLPGFIDFDGNGTICFVDQH